MSVYILFCQLFLFVFKYVQYSNFVPSVSLSASLCVIQSFSQSLYLSYGCLSVNPIMDVCLLCHKYYQFVSGLISLAICEAICLSTCQSINLYFSMSNSVSLSLSASLPVCQYEFQCLTEYRFVFLSVYVSVCQCVSRSMNQSSLCVGQPVCQSFCLLIFQSICISAVFLCRFLPINESAFLSISKSIILCVYIFFWYVCLSTRTPVFSTTFFYISVSQSSYPSISLSVNLTLFLCV